MLATFLLVSQDRFRLLHMHFDVLSRVSFACILMCFLVSSDSYSIFKIPSASVLVFISSLVLKQRKGLAE